MVGAKLIFEGLQHLLEGGENGVEGDDFVLSYQTLHPLQKGSEIQVA